MNNYCTNCGKKLEKDELVCKGCNVSVNNIQNNTEKKKTSKKILIIFLVCFLGYRAFNFAKSVVDKITINKLKKEYVEPYLERNYSDIDYVIKYDYSGKCIISGDCYFDPVMGCDGGSCKEYSYSDDSSCKSYYFTVKTDDDDITITVVKNGNIYTVVEGKNIYENKS